MKRIFYLVKCFLEECLISHVTLETKLCSSGVIQRKTVQEDSNQRKEKKHTGRTNIFQLIAQKNHITDLKDDKINAGEIHKREKTRVGRHLLVQWKLVSSEVPINLDIGFKFKWSPLAITLHILLSYFLLLCCVSSIQSQTVQHM